MHHCGNEGAREMEWGKWVVKLVISYIIAIKQMEDARNKNGNKSGVFHLECFPGRKKDIDPRFSYKHELRDRIAFYIE